MSTAVGAFISSARARLGSVAREKSTPFVVFSTRARDAALEHVAHAYAARATDTRVVVETGGPTSADVPLLNVTAAPHQTIRDECPNLCLYTSYGSVEFWSDSGLCVPGLLDFRMTYPARGGDRAPDAVGLIGPLHREALEWLAEHRYGPLFGRAVAISFGDATSRTLARGKPGSIVYCPWLPRHTELDPVDVVHRLARTGLPVTVVLPRSGTDSLREQLESSSSNATIWSGSLDALLERRHVVVTEGSSIALDFVATGSALVSLDSRCAATLSRELFPLVLGASAHARRAELERLLFPLGAPVTLEALEGAVTYAVSNAGEGARARVVYEHADPTDAVAQIVDDLGRHRLSSTPAGRRLVTRARSRMAPLAERLADRVNPWLAAAGFVLRRTGFLYFRGPDFMLGEAALRGLTVGELMDGVGGAPRAPVLDLVRRSGALTHAQRIVEIGAGTGMYVEVFRRELAAMGRRVHYEVYETEPGWRTYLAATYASDDFALVCHPADGSSLAATPSGSCDLVHAHGVFVALPPRQSFDYIAEAARVLRPGGVLVFDCHLSDGRSYDEVAHWWTRSYNWPAFVPDAVLAEFTAALGLRETAREAIQFGPAKVDYLVFVKGSLDAY